MNKTTTTNNTTVKKSDFLFHSFLKQVENLSCYDQNPVIALLVLLLIKNLKLKVKKLKLKFINLFKIFKYISNLVYKLNLFNISFHQN